MLGRDDVGLVTIRGRHALPFRNQPREATTDIGVGAKICVIANALQLHPVPLLLSSHCASPDPSGSLSVTLEPTASSADCPARVERGGAVPSLRERAPPSVSSGPPVDRFTAPRNCYQKRYPCNFHGQNA